MKRYSDKSKVKKIRVQKDGKNRVLFAEIIKEHSKTEFAPKIEREVNEFVIKNWGDFGETYLKHSIHSATYLCIVKGQQGRIVGIAPIRKTSVHNREIYFWGLTIIDKRYRACKLMNKMFKVLIGYIFLENIKRAKTRIDIVFITHTLKPLRAIRKVSAFLYPDPYSIKNGRVEEADKETWSIVNKILEVNHEKYTKLDREGCVMSGFYEENPHLLIKDEYYSHDTKLNEFAKKYLPNPGQEIVVRAAISLTSIAKMSFK
jgi:hypothetical protein